MEVFATEADVRLKFQLHDAALAPTALVERSVEDAHAELLRRLNPMFDTRPAEEGVILGETLLAGAHLFRSLASRDAFDQKDLVIGGQRIEPGRRFSALMTMASLAEEEAWRILEPYLRSVPGRAPAKGTDTTPVVGEG